MTIDRIFEGYRSWFQETYLRQLAEENEEDIADLEWSDPFADLHPLSAEQLSHTENNMGALPQGYRDLLSHVGVGSFLIAAEEEPVEFFLLSPEEIPQATKDFLSWLDVEAIQRANSREGLEVSKLVPFLTDPDGNQWALLTNQSPDDNRVVLFSHEQEQRDDLDLFSHQGPVESYFEKLFESARKLYSPWYLWTGFED